MKKVTKNLCFHYQNPANSLKKYINPTPTNLKLWLHHCFWFTFMKYYNPRPRFIHQETLSIINQKHEQKIQNKTRSRRDHKL